ncbi:YihY/virulence factor BrkB family protein [Halobacteriales archaeon QS_3_64_16]|nr:MAG: YihY/virulence factor BrkB family protein [Halobacteriales archaeon QS_3_64_16]
MSTNTRDLSTFGRTFKEQFQERDVTFIAASLAYYAFVSLIPLLLLSLVIATTVGGQDLANQIKAQVGSSMPAGAGQLLTSVLSGSPGAGGAAIAGIVALLWSALKLFRGMDVGFSKIYGAPGPDGIAEQIKDGLITFLAVILGVGVTIAIGATITAVPVSMTVAGVDLFGLVVSIVSILALSIALLPLYYFLPADDVSITEAIPGAVFAAFGWVALQTVFRIYAANSSKYAAYGVVGAVLLLVTVLYFASVVLLLGVLLNGILADRIGTGSRA